MSSPGSAAARWLRLAPLLLALLCPPLAALEDDREQPIRITADQALRDEKKGFTVYRGNVRMDQGSMHIEADSITIYHIEQEADRIVAEGQPARLRQQPDPLKGPVHASARTIEYYKIEDRVNLKGGAYIEQDGSTVAGETIDYFISEQRVIADSDQAREGSRVEVVIPAQQLQQSQDEDQDEDQRGAAEGQ